MASRKDRMQQRLRGVLRRDVQDVDFGLVFPVFRAKTTAASQPPKQPDTLRASLSFDQETPAKINPTIPDLTNSNDSKEEIPTVAQKANANTSKKRRRLDEDQTPSTTLNPPKSSRKSLNSLENLFTQDNTIPEAQSSDLSNYSLEQASQGVKIAQASTHYFHSPKLNKTPTQVRKTIEVTESPENAPGSGKRIHGLESILPPSRSQSSQNKKSKRFNSNTPLSSIKHIRGSSVKKSQNLDTFEKKFNQGGHVKVDGELDELSPERSFLSGNKAKTRPSGPRRYPVEVANEELSRNTDNYIDDLSPERSFLSEPKARTHSSSPQKYPAQVASDESSRNTDNDIDELSPERSFLSESKARTRSSSPQKYPVQVASDESSRNTDNDIDELSPERFILSKPETKSRSSLTPRSSAEVADEESSRNIDNDVDELSPEQSSQKKKLRIRGTSSSKISPVEAIREQLSGAKSPQLGELLQEHPSRPRKAKIRRSPQTKLYSVRSAAKEVTEALDQDFDELSPEFSSHSRPDGSRSQFEFKNSLDYLGQNECSETINDEQSMANPNEIKTIETSGIRADSPDLDMSLGITDKNVLKSHQNKQGTQPPSRKKDVGSVSKIKKSKRCKYKPYDETHIPITVHRLSTPVIYEDDTADADILNMDMPYRKRGDVNFMDVLSHVSQEIIDEKISKLSEIADSYEDTALRRDNKVKLQALEAFRTELKDQLLGYALYLDNAHILERRLRDEQRKRIHLRAEILRIRAEREQVALRIDEIRTEHEKSQDQSMKQNSLNNAIHDLELAIDVGRNADPSAVNDKMDIRGTEVLLKKINQEISSQSSSSGILGHVKDFNSFLERVAVALEMRVR